MALVLVNGQIEKRETFESRMGTQIFHNDLEILNWFQAPLLDLKFYMQYETQILTRN